MSGLFYARSVDRLGGRAGVTRQQPVPLRIASDGEAEPVTGEPNPDHISTSFVEGVIRDRQASPSPGGRGSERRGFRAFRDAVRRACAGGVATEWQ
jgi:hypothetical protein